MLLTRHQAALAVSIGMLLGVGSPSSTGDSNSGASAAPDRFHIVFVAEGYRDGEKDAYLKQVGLFVDAICNQAPFSDFLSRYRITIRWTPSRDAGIPVRAVWTDGKWTTLATERETAFQTRLSVGRHIIQVTDFRTVLRIVDSVDDPIDNMIVVVNSDEYGGTGTFAASLPAVGFHALRRMDAPISWEDAQRKLSFGMTIAAKRNGERVLIHELGHSVGNLGEEYFNSRSAFSGNPDQFRDKPNVSTTNDPGRVGWKDLLGRDGVGIFEGAHGRGKGLYRPWNNGCVMRSEGNTKFCPVCDRALRGKLGAGS